MDEKQGGHLRIASESEKIKCVDCHGYDSSLFYYYSCHERTEVEWEVAWKQQKKPVSRVSRREDL